MKKILLALVLLAATNVSAVYMSSCYNYGDDVSFSFTSCISRNFSTAGVISSCYNYGDELSSSYQSCVNRNFSNLSREYGIYVQSCYNYGDGVSFSYESCVNRNFSEVGRAMDRR